MNLENLLAGDEGFEPPQTESESGVLPLHKSPIMPLRQNAYIIISAFLEMSSCFFTFFHSSVFNSDRA